MVAAFLVDEHIGTLGALAGQVLGETVVLEGGPGFLAYMLLQHAGDGVGAGQDGLAFRPGHAGTADTAELLNYRGDIYPGAQRQGNKATDSFKLGDGTGARLAEGREDLADTVVVVGNGDIE